MKRRPLLSILGTSALTVAGGCLSTAPSPQLQLRNRDATNRELTVTITETSTGADVLTEHYSLAANSVDTTVENVFPNPGKYQVCVSTEWAKERCDTWEVDTETAPTQFHISVNVGDEDGDGDDDGPYLRMGPLG